VLGSIVNLFVMPAFYLRFGTSRRSERFGGLMVGGDAPATGRTSWCGPVEGHACRVAGMSERIEVRGW
jgi:hypothetical protein